MSNFWKDASAIAVAVCVFALCAIPLSLIPPNPGSGHLANATSIGERGALIATLDPEGAGYRDDTRFLESVYDRIVELPQALFSQYGVADMLTGVGLVGASGTLGFGDVVCTKPETQEDCHVKYPMAHNAFVEFLAIGGIPLLAIILTLFAVTTWRAARSYAANPDDASFATSALMVLILVIANAPMTSGIIFQPYIATAVFLTTLPILLRCAQNWTGR